MTPDELNVLIRALTQAVAPQRTFLCQEMQDAHRELSWLGVQYASSAILGIKPVRRGGLGGDLR